MSASEGPFHLAGPSTWAWEIGAKGPSTHSSLPPCPAPPPPPPPPLLPQPAAPAPLKGVFQYCVEEAQVQVNRSPEIWSGREWEQTRLFGEGSTEEGAFGLPSGRRHSPLQGLMLFANINVMTVFHFAALSSMTMAKGWGLVLLLFGENKPFPSLTFHFCF